MSIVESEVQLLFFQIQIFESIFIISTVMVSPLITPTRNSSLALLFRFFILASESWLFDGLTFAKNRFISMFKLVILHRCNFVFLNEGINQKFYDFQRCFKQSFAFFNYWNEILIVQKSNLSKFFNFSQKSDSHFSLATNLNFSSINCLENSTLVENFWIGTAFNLTFACNGWHHETSNMCYF